MIIYSDRESIAFKHSTAADNAQFFAEVASELDAPGPIVLLAGGSDFASCTVRSQQALMRFDRRPSDYSHAALICDFRLETPEQSWGLELDALHVPASRQVPEHAGVTEFRLAEYFDSQAFPNLALIHIPLPTRAQVDAVITAARTPNRDLTRFPLWRWLAAWRAFVTAPETMPHPLQNRIPHPGAAFVAMAYEAAEITLIPGATDVQHCPELLWANAKHWGHAVSAEVDIQAFRVRRDEHAQPRAALAVPIAVPDLGPTARKARAAKTRSNKTRSRSPQPRHRRRH